MFPWIDNWAPLGIFQICIKDMQGDISPSPGDVKFITSGLQGKNILVA